MPNNIVFVTAFDPMNLREYRDYSSLAWSYWCEKNDVRLFYFNKDCRATKGIPVVWKKYFVFDVLDEMGIDYSHVALVDMDTIVHPFCPNFFDYADSSLGAVLDYDDPAAIQSAINFYKNDFSESSLNWNRFFNTGVMLVNQGHRKFLKNTYEKFCALGSREQSLEGDEQKDLSREAFVNLMFKEEGLSINVLPKFFNITNPYQKELCSNDGFVNIVGIWHFNDLSVQAKAKFMHDFWGVVPR